MSGKRTYILDFVNIEYEIKVLDIDKSAIIKKIEGLGGKFIADYHFKRYIFDVVPSSPNKWLRLRTDGETSTLTYKNSESDSIQGMKEIEIVVDDFERTLQLLKAAGFSAKSYQENRRHLYKLGNVELAIDEWPHIPPYLEIEAQTKSDVEEILEKMDVSDLPTTSLPTEDVYLRYGKNLRDFNPLKFTD